MAAHVDWGGKQIYSICTKLFIVILLLFTMYVVQEH